MNEVTNRWNNCRIKDTSVKILPLYCRQYWNCIPYSYLLPGGIYLVLLLRAICRLWKPLPHKQGIPYLSTYTTFLRCPTIHLHSHKVIALPGPRSGHQRTQLTSIPTKYPEPPSAPTKSPQQMSASGQISPTGVDPGSIVSSRCCSSRSGAVIGPNQPEPRPNISNRRRGSNDLHQVVSTSLARRRDYARLSPTDTTVP